MNYFLLVIFSTYSKLSIFRFRVYTDKNASSEHSYGEYYVFSNFNMFVHVVTILLDIFVSSLTASNENVWQCEVSFIAYGFHDIFLLKYTSH